MMKIRLGLRLKLSLAFWIFLIATVFLVGFFANQAVAEHFKRFCEGFEGLPRCLYGQGGQMFLRSINQSLIIVGIVGSVVAFLFGYLFALYFLRPIEKIIESTKKVSAGDYKERIKLKTNDEIDGLVQSLNEMFDNLGKTEMLRRDLIANMSHELSTPLTNIYGYLEAISDNVIAERGEKEKAIQLIKDETERLISLIQELKNLAVLESESSQLFFIKTNINNIVKKVVKIFNPKLLSKKIVLTTTLASNLPDIKLDQNKIQQALSNLLDNAIKYSPENGNIEIVTSKLGRKWIKIEVNDHGEGIKKEDLPFVFERFFCADKSRSNRKGIGIGLTITKKIVEAHGGKVEVESKYKRGSSFIILLPVNIT